ncbi:hypothetical protein [Clostridium sp.]|uniref:hypothetical protein n=1 Tax=Clostridium sp. TaxID=1506 RepID=UPI001A55E274|nr:hypothetical protein [Clostridium sp.]MBK5237340.1 hypothetical protein [Clostridium sp.]
MINFIDMLNCTLATVEEEKKKINNRFDEDYSVKMEDLISKISKEYEDLEKVAGRCRWIEIGTDLEVGINAYTELAPKEEYGFGKINGQFQYSVLQYKKVTYALNSKAEGLFLGGCSKIKPLKEGLLIYLKNEDLIKLTIMGKFKKEFEENLNKKLITMKDTREFAELVDSHY